MRKNIFGKIIFVALGLFTIPSYSALPQSHVMTKPKSLLMGEGFVSGGMAGKGFTLLDVRRTADKKKKIERFVFDVGDLNGRPLRTLPGYFHAQLQKKPQRLILDFAQMPQSNIDQERIISKLKGSFSVRNVLLNLEPVDNSLNLTMDLKNVKKVRVFEAKGNKSTSKVVVDFIYK